MKYYQHVKKKREICARLNRLPVSWQKNEILTWELPTGTEVETSVPKHCCAKIPQIPYQLSCSVNVQKYHIQLNVTWWRILAFFGEQIMPYFLTLQIKIQKKKSEEQYWFMWENCEK